jgi:hypothetical protein
MKTNATPVTTGSHNIVTCLDAAQINPNLLVATIRQGLANPPKHKTLRDAVRYKVQSIQAERFIFLLALGSQHLASQ